MKTTNKKSACLAALRAAFPYTIPILTGFLFLGITYGVYMRTAGFALWYPAVMSLAVYAGSMQFVAVDILLGAFNPVQAFLMTLMVNARHLFYGLAMLKPYEDMGWKKPLLIFGMSDETFSVNCSAKIPADIDRPWFMLWVAILNYLYWFIGTVLGGVFGSFVWFSTEGLDFVMTAMFMVIFLEQWQKDKDHTCALVGLVIPVIALLIFGADSFMIPAMIGIMAALTLLRGKLDKGGNAA